ncbi:MAG: hypothetical protein MUF15_10595 [Acidobacteria bacterium]|jgi:hypothetical protein|nr:hypothetical protein [Acidobacteriota bacterium]
MQQVLVNIENRELERKLLAEANKKGRKLANVILEVLEKNFIPKKSSADKLHYRRLNPLKHMSKIEYESDEMGDIDLNEVKPFEKIKDSAAYVKEMRKCHVLIS